MSDTATRIPWTLAHPLAAKLADLIRPACDRLEIAGSVRRKKVYIGDIEIVCVPRSLPAMLSLLEELAPASGGLFGEGAARQLTLIKGGKRQRQYAIEGHPDTKLDLFITTAPQWGYQLAIRTGPAEYSHRLVYCRKIGGLLRDGLSVKFARVWKAECVPGTDDEDKADFSLALPTPEEIDFLNLAGGWVEPWERK